MNKFEILFEKVIEPGIGNSKIEDPTKTEAAKDHIKDITNIEKDLTDREKKYEVGCHFLDQVNEMTPKKGKIKKKDLTKSEEPIKPDKDGESEKGQKLPANTRVPKDPKASHLYKANVKIEKVKAKLRKTTNIKLNEAKVEKIAGKVFKPDRNGYFYYLLSPSPKGRVDHIKSSLVKRWRIHFRKLGLFVDQAPKDPETPNYSHIVDIVIPFTRSEVEAMGRTATEKRSAYDGYMVLITTRAIQHIKDRTLSGKKSEDEHNEGEKWFQVKSMKSTYDAIVNPDLTYKTSLNRLYFKEKGAVPENAFDQDIKDLRIYLPNVGEIEQGLPEYEAKSVSFTKNQNVLYREPSAKDGEFTEYKAKIVGEVDKNNNVRIYYKKNGIPHVNDVEVKNLKPLSKAKSDKMDETKQKEEDKTTTQDRKEAKEIKNLAQPSIDNLDQI